jgi:hypothetical protein
VVNLVKVEGTLDELRELFGRVERGAKRIASAAQEVAKVTKKGKRKLSDWQRYIANSKNHIKFSRGPKKGRLDLSKMSKAYKRSRK